MRIPRRTWRTRTPRTTAAWLIGGLLLLSSSWLDHVEWKEQSSPRDQELFLRYVQQLAEVHHVLTEHPETPAWAPHVLGYRNAGEVLEEIEMAYRGAESAGFLPEEAGRARISPSSHDAHPGFDRLLRLGILQMGLLALALPFAMVALWRLISGEGAMARRPRVWAHWSSSRVLALVFWSLLLTQFAGTLAYTVITLAAPSLVQSAWASVIESLLYVILQGGPVLLCAALLLPRKRHFTRVFGLGADQLLRPATFTLGFGLFGLDTLFNFGLYELEKLGGQIDTRDFLTVTLIDAPLPGLLSELFSAAVVAPIGEEILFRGFLFHGLRGRLGTWGAALASSLLFGAMHYYSWFGMAAIALFGMFTCWIVARTGSLWPGILVHALANFLITLGSWYAFSDFSYAP